MEIIVAARSFQDGGAAYSRGDYATAMQLWRPLADQGDPYAQTNLGRVYANGQGVPQDYAAAASWYRKAADQGDVYAQYNLGILYANGRGVVQNYAEAVNWYRKAADQGLASAQFNLGDMYFNGRGVPQDNILAYMWFDLAAARGRENAGNNRDVYVARRMTSTQIAEAQRLAREWKPTCRPLPAFCGRQ
jgi:TPR repeat protein